MKASIITVLALLVACTQAAINIVDFTACAVKDKTACTSQYMCCATFTLADQSTTDIGYYCLDYTARVIWADQYLDGNDNNKAYSW